MNTQKVMTLMFSYALALAMLQSALTAPTPSGVVQTTHGAVRGTVDEFAGSVYTSFTGIPFAKPPVGALRFKPPQQPDSWDDVLNATEFSSICPQVLQDMPDDDMRSEDCLHLNVYVSGDVAQNRSESLPVMVYIHGGGLSMGSAPSFDGTLLVTQAEPIVLVTIQYRLGILGFFSSGDSEVPGNAGFLDQVLALQWVRDNIDAFGGDSSRVTVFGQSSGGQSVLMHLISPMSAGLFHRAIAQSPVASWRFPELDVYRGHYYDMAMAEHNCTAQDTLVCLQNMPWQELINDDNWNPVIDGTFLLEQPQDAFANGRFHADVDVIIGFNNDDALDTAAGFVDFVFNTANFGPLVDGVSDAAVTDHVLETSLTLTVSELGLENPQPTYPTYDGMFTATRHGTVPTNHDQITTMLRSKYTNSNDPIQNARLLLDSLRDSAYVAFSLWTAAQLGAHDVNIYVYSFNHRSAHLGSQPTDEVQLGAPHGHDVLYVFGAPSLGSSGSPSYTTDEAALSQVMMTSWTTFATNG